MTHYLDSSALVKRYVQEAGSAEVQRIFRGRGELASSRLSLVEVASAFARRGRDGSIDEDAIARHRDDLRDDLQRFRIVEPRPAVIDLAFDLVERRELRGYDAIQLASALHFHSSAGVALTFWCADKALAAAARAEKLRTRIV